MKKEIYKINFAKFLTEKYKGHTDLSQKEMVFHLNGQQDLRHPIYSVENNFHDENTFVENFANPLCSVFRDYCMIVIEENDDKISLKFFFGGKSRNVGKPYFKTYKNVEFLTVNKLTGDFYVGNLLNYQKKRKFTRSIRRNYFANSPMSSIISKIKNYLTRYCDNSSEIIYEVTQKFFERLTEPVVHLDSDQTLMKFYLDKKGFKYPNNFWIYMQHMWGKEYRKVLKNNDKRLVDTFMQMWKLKGGKIKKCLHTCENLNVELYDKARKLFGEDWLNQDGEIIKELLNRSNRNINFPENFKSFLTHEELKKVYSVFKKMVINDIINDWTFNDHIITYTTLKEFGQTEIKWSTDGSNSQKFQEEHLDWTDKLDHYRKGFYKRTYTKYFYEKIQKPIDGFYPVILKTSEEYNHESYNQSNCVKGYIGRVGSMIISLRKNSIDSMERATIEYRVRFLKNAESVITERVQTLGRYNQYLDNTWNDVLLKLDEIVLSCHQDKNFESVKIEKECKNGVKFFSSSHFDENGNLTWTDRKTKENNYVVWDF